MRHLYGGASQETLADSVEDVTKGLTGAGLRGRRESVVLVDAPSKGPLGRRLSVLFAVKAGPKTHARAETHYDALTQTGRTN